MSSGAVLDIIYVMMLTELCVFRVSQVLLSPFNTIVTTGRFLISFVLLIATVLFEGLHYALICIDMAVSSQMSFRFLTS